MFSPFNNKRKIKETILLKVSWLIVRCVIHLLGQLFSWRSDAIKLRIVMCKLLYIVMVLTPNNDPVVIDDR